MQNLYNINDYHVELNKLGKVIVYLRKSREDLIDGRYASDEETLARHEAQLQQWAKSRLGHEIPQNCIFKEIGSGEKIKNRPVFQEVLKLLETDQSIDGILAVNCSRLSRGDLKDCGTLMDIVEHTETLVLTPQKTYNLKNRYDKRFFKDELLRGNDYLETTKELLGNGRHWSVSVGKYIYSKPPFGYDRVTCKEMKVADEKGYTLRPNADAEYVKMIFEMYDAGAGCFKIATHLKDISAPTRSDKEWDHCKIKGVLDNVSYIGLVTYGRRKTIERIIDGEVVEKRERVENPPTYKGLHEPLISADLWERVQARRATFEPPIKRGLLAKNPLMGIVKCGVCGRGLVRKSSKKTTSKRKFDLDKAGLQALMRDHHARSGLSSAELARRVGVSASTLHDWLNSETRFFAGKGFIAKWEKLKSVLAITDNSFDTAIYEFEEVPFSDTLSCGGHKCGNVSSPLTLVEDQLLDMVSAKLKDYSYYVDNYAEEITKKATAAEKARENFDKKIATKEMQLKNAKIAYEKGVDSIDEYIERKTELVSEINELRAKIAGLSETQEIEQVEVIRKSVPLLANVISSYHTFEPHEKNELLKDIVSSVEYMRESKGEIKLDVCWLI